MDRPRIRANALALLNGFIRMLEGASVQDDTTAIDFSDVSFSIS
jgi:hypothetical protein